MSNYPEAVTKITNGYLERMKAALRTLLEPDEGGYHAYCPALRRFGAVTQGSTPAEALKNINEVVQMIMDELKEDGIALPSPTILRSSKARMLP